MARTAALDKSALPGRACESKSTTGCEEGRFGRREGARGLVRSRGLKAGDTAKNTVRAKPQSGDKVSSGSARKGREWREPINFGPTLDTGRRGVKTCGVRPFSVLKRVQRTTGRCSGAGQFVCRAALSRRIKIQIVRFGGTQRTGSSHLIVRCPRTFGVSTVWCRPPFERR